MAPSSRLSFHNFSFDAASSSTNQNMPNVSPFSRTATSDTSATDLSYLTQQFSRQTLSSDARMSRAYNYPVEPYQQANMSSQSDSPYSFSSVDYSQGYASSSQSVRYHRQANSRLQYDPSRAREISSNQVTASADQFYMRQPQLQSTYIYPDPRPDYDPDEFDNEGIDMTSEENPSMDLSYRRSTDFSAEGRVQRPIRIRRKKNRPKSESSSRTLG